MNHLKLLLIGLCVNNRGRIEWEFGGNCYVTFMHKNEFKATRGSDDTRVEIDRAMEMCK